MEHMRKKIIIVDDNAANLSVGRNLLKAYYEVYPAPSAAKLFDILEKIIPDLILLDVNMPEMNGYEAIKVLKADHRFASIPVIFLTAKNDEESEMEGFDLGAADYVTKPFSGPLLLRRIASQLLLQQQNRDLIASRAALQDYADNLELKVREKTAAKTVFLASMSHEIRTPMNSIIGFSELALDDNISLKTKGYLTKILENSEWLLHIINDILEITNIESGKIDLNNVKFNLHEVLNGCHKMFMPRASEYGLMLNFYIDPAIDKALMGDPVRLRQALTHLLSNAIKFTRSGVVEFQIEARKKTKNTVNVHFEIGDTGIGMTPEQLEIIFEPFTQVESGTTRKYGGTGLGLTITKNIVEMMGGAISVESTPGVGSKFSFEISFDTVSESEEACEDNTALSGLKKPRFEGEILVCEDNIMNQQVVTEYLAKVGLSAVVAENGRIGVEMVRSRMQEGSSDKQFDLIFMDIHMPVMDGIDATGKILELGAGVPIVAMTANIMPEDVEKYKAIGMVDCVGKPFTAQELWLCLMKYLKPVDWKTEDSAESERIDSVLQQKLIKGFMAKNKGILGELKAAMDSGDIRLAYRIAHNLKSNAGQLKKKLLQKAAEEVESCLKDGKNLVTAQHIVALEAELNAALEEFASTASHPGQPVAESELMDAAAVRKLLEDLEPFLKDSDPECLSFIDDLRFVPGSEELIRQIENFDYKPAMESLSELMKKAK